MKVVKKQEIKRVMLDISKFFLKVSLQTVDLGNVTCKSNKIDTLSIYGLGDGFSLSCR